VENEHEAFRQFVDAVLDFSDEPEPANLERYLAASRALEESRLQDDRQPDPIGRKENPR
jgi:hypothetical protein